MQSLKGKNVLVTGGSRGIGQAIVLAFLAEGAQVAFTCRSQSSATATLEKAQALGGKCLALPGDVTQAAACQEAVDQCIAQLGSLDVLVNNAGITKDGLFMKMSEEQWDEVIQTNLKGMYNFCKAVVKPMIKARQGRIINITSIVGVTGNPGQTNYCASKAGMIGFTKSLAKELAARNITVNALAPGFIATDMTDELPEAQKEALNAQIPLKRMGSPEDIANGVLFLASDRASYITGTVLHVNGGMY